MPVKANLTADEFQALPEDAQAFYVESDDGYKLDFEAPKSNEGELKRALERERADRKAFKSELDKLKAELEDKDTLDAKKRGDIERLEEQWGEKNSKLKKTYEEKLSSKDRFIRSTLIDNEAMKIATKICDGKDVDLILPHIKARLSADLEAETPVTKVLDSTGNVSALTIDELTEEFVANPKFASIIVASKASGSGTADSQLGEHNGAMFDKKTVDYSKMSPKDFAKVVKAKADSKLSRM